MMEASYELHLETGDVDQNSFLGMFRFPTLESPLNHHSSNLKLCLKEKSLQAKLEYDQNVDGKHHIHNYTSNHPPVKDDQLFVAQIVNDRIVLRKAPFLFTLRYDFSHLNPKEEIDTNEEVRPVSVKFAGPEKPQRHAAYKNDDADIQDEYRTLSIHSLDSFEAINARASLFGEKKPKIKPEPVESYTQSSDRVETMDMKPKIEPDTAPMDIDIPETEFHRDPSSMEKPINIKKEVHEFLLRAQIVSYQEVMNYLKKSYPSSEICDKDLVTALSDFALLVQGNWVIKGEVLYGSGGDITDVTGISINLYSSARDYLLLLYTQNREVSRADFRRKVRIPDYDIETLFKQVATLQKESKLWEFKLSTDNDFMERYPELVQRQNTFWKVRKANKLSIFA